MCSEMLKLPMRIATPQVDTFIAPKPMEKVSALKVYDYPRQQQAPERVRIADLLIPDCNMGDQLACMASIQATNERPYAVEFTAGLKATKSSTGTSGIFIDYEHGYNISPHMVSGGIWHGLHHGPLSLGGHWVVPEDGDWYVTVVAYAGGSSFTPDPYDWLVLDNIGDLSVQRIRIERTMK